MPIFNDTLLTERGYEAANKAANGQYSFTLTRAVASPRDYRELSDSSMRQLTSLDRECAGKIAAQDNVDSKKSKITTKFSNEIEPKGYMANTVGIYAKGDDGKEFLYSVTPSTIGQVIPEQNNNIFSGFSLAIYVIVGNVQNMKVELSPGGDASVDYVDRVVSQAKDDINAVLKLKMNRNADGTVPDSANFVNGIQKNGLDVATVKYVDDATINVNVTVLPNNTDLNSVQKTGTYRLLWNYNYSHTPPEAPNGTTFLLEVVNIEDEIYQSIRYSSADGYVNRKLQFGSWTSWLEQATKQYVNEQTTRQFDNSLKAAKDYAVGDNHDDTIMVNGQRVNLTPTKFTNSEQEAIDQANDSVKPALFVYPTDAGTTNVYKHVLGIYAFGTGGLRVINLVNADTNKYDFINAYALYNEATKTVTLHGLVKAKASGNNNDSIFSFAIDSLNMNYITNAFLNSQPMTVDSNNTYLKSVTGKSNTNFSSGKMWDIEGATITLGYDKAMIPVIPDWVPSGAISLKDGDDFNYVNNEKVYFVPKGVIMKNAPFLTSENYTVTTYTKGSMYIQFGTNGTNKLQRWTLTSNPYYDGWTQWQKA